MFVSTAPGGWKALTVGFKAEEPLVAVELLFTAIGAIFAIGCPLRFDIVSSSLRYTRGFQIHYVGVVSVQKCGVLCDARWDVWNQPGNTGYKNKKKKTAILNPEPNFLSLSLTYISSPSKSIRSTDLRCKLHLDPHLPISHGCRIYGIASTCT